MVTLIPLKIHVYQAKNWRLWVMSYWTKTHFDWISQYLSHMVNINVWPTWELHSEFHAKQMLVTRYCQCNHAFISNKCDPAVSSHGIITSLTIVITIISVLDLIPIYLVRNVRTTRRSSCPKNNSVLHEWRCPLTYLTSVEVGSFQYFF